MKKASYIFILLLVLCLFPVFSFASTQTTIELRINEVRVNCNSNGCFKVDKAVYKNSKSFFKTNDDSIVIETIPNANCKIESIKYNTQKSKVAVEGNYIKIFDINDNITVNIEYTENDSIFNNIIEEKTEDAENIEIKEEFVNSDNHDNFDGAFVQEITYGIGKISVVIPKINGFEFVEIPNTSKLIQEVFTKEEMNSIENGANFTIVLEVKICEDDKVPIKEKTIIENYMKEISKKGNKIGNYVDINLYKINDNGGKQYITNTEKPIEIIFNLPEEICFKNAEYDVLYVENDNVVSLKDFDEDYKTITIETNNFSTYAITYTTSKYCNICWLILLIIILIMINLIWKKRKNREENL